jgi:hypothetical protein
MRIDPAIVARFWPKVQIGNGCWLWTAATVPSGYGSLGIDRKQHGAHRISWAIANGRWPDGMVLHRCGTKRCVRPDHLYIGTASQNTEDARQHGTLPQGEGHGNAKLTYDDVEAIRTRYAAGETQTSIANDFPVTQSQVSNIVRGVQRGGDAIAPNGDSERYVQQCETCNATFYRKPGGRLARYCSPACRGASQRLDTARNCTYCGTEYYRPPSAKGETCSYACMGKLRTQRNNAK